MADPAVERERLDLLADVLSTFGTVVREMGALEETPMVQSELMPKTIAAVESQVALEATLRWLTTREGVSPELVAAARQVYREALLEDIRVPQELEKEWQEAIPVLPEVVAHVEEVDRRVRAVLAYDRELADAVRAVG